LAIRPSETEESHSGGITAHNATFSVIDDHCISERIEDGRYDFREGKCSER
jgi:hypothetical protein